MDALCQAWLNLPPGSGEEDEHVKKFTDKLTGRRTDERQQAIRKAHELSAEES